MDTLPDTAVCLGCGYALRGLPARVCPECGGAFDPADPSTWRDLMRPRSSRLWLRWAGPLPRWHKALLILWTIIACDAISLWPYRPAFEIFDLPSIPPPAFLIGLYLSYALRQRANALCVSNGWRRFQRGAAAAKSRTVRFCAGALAITLLLMPLSLPLHVRVVLSMPFLEYKAHGMTPATPSERGYQLIGLFLVERVTPFGDGGMKMVLPSPLARSWSREAIVYHPWRVRTPPKDWIGDVSWPSVARFTRWSWMGWQ